MPANRSHMLLRSYLMMTANGTKFTGKNDFLFRVKAFQAREYRFRAKLTVYKDKKFEILEEIQRHKKMLQRIIDDLSRRMSELLRSIGDDPAVIYRIYRRSQLKHFLGATMTSLRKFFACKEGEIE